MNSAYGTMIPINTDEHTLSRFGVVVGEEVTINGKKAKVVGCGEGRIWYQDAMTDGSLGDEGIWCDWTAEVVRDDAETFDLDSFSAKVNSACLVIQSGLNIEGSSKDEDESMEGKEEVGEKEMSEGASIVASPKSEEERLFNSLIDFFCVHFSMLMRHLTVPDLYLSWIKRMRSGIQLDAKKKVLRSSFLPDTNSVDLRIDREAAVEARYCSSTTLQDENSLLSSGYFLIQLFRSLKAHSKSKNGLIKPRYFQQSHAFYIRSGYADNAVDMKGPFRNFVSDIASEWWGSTAAHGLALFIPSDTHHSSSVEIQDLPDRFSWIPNPTFTTPFHLRLFRLVGQMIGCFLYSDVQVEILWPRVVWQWLVGKEDEMVPDDYIYFNTAMSSLLHRLSTAKEEDWNAEFGGYQDCLAVLPELLRSEEETEKVIFHLWKLASLSTETMNSQESMDCVPEFENLSLPFELKDMTVKEIQNAFLNSRRPQLDAIREGLYSGDDVLDTSYLIFTICFSDSRRILSVV